MMTLSPIMKSIRIGEDLSLLSNASMIEQHTFKPQIFKAVLLNLEALKNVNLILIAFSLKSFIAELSVLQDKGAQAKCPSCQQPHTAKASSLKRAGRYSGHDNCSSCNGDAFDAGSQNQST